MLKGWLQLLGHLPIIACHTAVFISLADFSLDRTAWHLGFHILAVQLFAGILIWREAVKHWAGHVDAVEDIWKMMNSVNSVSRFVILLHTFSATNVLFVRKAANFVEDCHILASMEELSWSCFLPQSRWWKAKFDFLCSLAWWTWINIHIFYYLYLLVENNIGQPFMLF